VNPQSIRLVDDTVPFRRLVEAVNGLAIFTLDKNGNVTSWSSGAEIVKGYAADEIIGQHFSVFCTEEDRRLGKPANFLDRARTTGRVSWDGWSVRKDGSRFWANIVIDAIGDKDGEFIGFAKVTRDISVRHRSEERFRQVVESAPNAIVLINPSGTIEMVNTQAERVFGYDRAALLGRPVEMLIPPRLRHHHPGLRTAFFTAPQSRSMGAGRDLYALKKDGSEFPVEIGLNPVETDEGTMVLSAIVDISDRKQKEERILAALKEKDLMLGEIHHRVKNNLQVVCSLLDLQSSSIEDKVALNLLTESQNRVRSMALIHQMLYESKDFVRVDFGSFLDNLVPSLVTAYGTDPELISLAINAVEVRLPINTAIPCGLVVNELISNALKHAFPANRPGEIKIDLASEPDGNVVLSVSDDGIGMPEDCDLGATTTLGLQLVTLFADQLGADMTIHRRNPTRFELRFPISRPR
jgi:PAS domain S-box-containing protein